MERINVRIEEELKIAIDAEARAKGVSPSEIVREVLEAHLRSKAPRENCQQLAERLGLVASVKGLPADLSTNPVHMQGFGRG